jgi:hypothetical protein
MVVYLYKKGRQTMKNTITTIAMFILSILSVKAQQTYVLDSILVFKYQNSHGLNSREFLGYSTGQYKITLSPDMDSMVTLNINTNEQFKEKIVSVESNNIFGDTTYNIKSRVDGQEFKIILTINLNGEKYLLSKIEVGSKTVGWECKQKRTE